MEHYTEEYIAKLIFYHLQGIADDEQEQELNVWLNLSPDHEKIYSRLSKQGHWEDCCRRFIKDANQHEKGWQQLNDRIRKSQPSYWILWRKYAAVILLLMGIGGGLFFSINRKMRQQPIGGELAGNNLRPKAHTILTLEDGTELDLKDEMSRWELTQRNQALQVSDEALSYQASVDTLLVDEYHTLTVPRGAEYVLVLADGSKVYLNAESKLTFPTHFNKTERRVVLEGEAYFQVEKNPVQPFIVEVKPLEIEVVGTTFGIRAYQDESGVWTTLETGRVRIHNGKSNLDLLPDEQAVFDRRTTTMEVKEVDVTRFLAWKEGRIIFDDCPLENILTELGRWYDLDIFYSREEMRSYRFSLNIQKHESFVEVLKLLEKADDIHFEINDNTIIVR